MTPDRQPHPQRCETCKNTVCEYYEIRDNMSAGHDERTGWRASPAVITFAVGCATHSSTPAPAPDEYIITDEIRCRLIGILVMARDKITLPSDEILILIAALVNSRPAPSAPEPTAEHRTYESCHKHFSCPDGEECWYWSQDYYWDCGNGASRLHESWAAGAKSAREQVLDEAVSAMKESAVFERSVFTVLESLRVQPESTGSREK